jgi:hypothetical protein
VVALDPQGNAVLTWLCQGRAGFRVQARTLSSSGVLGPIQRLSHTHEDAFGPQVAVDSDGDAVFTWERQGRVFVRVQARALSSTGILGPVQAISHGGSGGFNPQVAVRSDGKAIFTWTHANDRGFRVQARTRSAAGVLGPVRNLSAVGRDFESPQVALDAHGSAVFVWDRLDRTRALIETRERSAAGRLSPLQTLADVSIAKRDVASPQLGVDAEGDAVYAWTRARAGEEPHRIDTQTRSDTGVLGPVQPLAAGNHRVAAPLVAVNADGAAAVTWSLIDPSRERVQAAFGP